MDMKNTFLKTIKIIVKILVVAGLIWLIFHVASEIHLVSDISKLFSPKAEKPNQSTDPILEYPLFASEKVLDELICGRYFTDGNRTIGLVNIVNKTGDYDGALDLLLTNIRKISKCNKENSEAIDYKYESTLYQKLADTLKLKGDTKRAEQALVKSKQAKAMAARLLADEKKQREKQLDKLLADTAK